MMKTIKLMMMAGVLVGCVSCKTTDVADDGMGGYQDPYAGYGGYGSGSDYVQVTPSGDPGADAYGGYQGGGYEQPAAVTPPSQPTYTPPPTYTSTPAPAARTYTVVKGDTLYRISKQHGVTVDSLMAANSLSGTTIFPGDVLSIP